MTGRIDDLERLAKLHQDGVLTDAEFAQEKARLLGGDEPRSSEPARASEAMPDLAATAAKAVAPDDNDLLAPVRPITNAAYAAFLIRKTWAGVASLIAANALSSIPEVRESLSPGLGLMEPEPLPTAVVVAGALLGCLIVGLFGYWLVRRRSRIAAVLLFIMAMSVVVFGASLPWDRGIWINLAVIGLGLFSIWFFVGAWRGLTFISRLSKGEAEAAMVLPTTNAAPTSERMKAAWKEGREQSRPVRRIIRWIGLAWLAIFAAGGVWFWVTTRAELPTITDDTPALTPEMSPSPPIVTSQSIPPAPASPTDVGAVRRDWFVGRWVEDWDTCGSDLEFTLTAGGQYISNEWTGSWSFDGENIGWNRQCRPDVGCGNLEYMADGQGRAVILSDDAFEQRFNGAAEGTKFKRCG